MRARIEDEEEGRGPSIEQDRGGRGPKRRRRRRRRRRCAPGLGHVLVPCRLPACPLCLVTPIRATFPPLIIAVVNAIPLAPLALVSSARIDAAVSRSRGRQNEAAHPRCNGIVVNAIIAISMSPRV